MCGACDDSLVSFQPEDIGKYTPEEGGEPQIGRVEELSKIWGVGVMWQDGERQWFPYDDWCPLKPEPLNLVLTSARFELTSVQLPSRKRPRHCGPAPSSGLQGEKCTKSCSFVELVAEEPQKPKWFVSSSDAAELPCVD